MTDKDRIIKKFQEIEPGLRELLMIMFPSFETFYLDENEVIHLVDNERRTGISIQQENKKSAILSLRLSQNDVNLNSVSVCFRISTLDVSIGSNGLHYFSNHTKKETDD